MTSGWTDIGRQCAVSAGVVLQVVMGAVGGTGLIGESIGDVANSYATPLLPVGTTFAIWNVIYLATVALGVYQLLPGQRTRALHRRTGWLLVAAAVTNAGWVVLYAYRIVVPAEVMLVGLLVVLAIALRRVSRRPAYGVADRLLVHLPIALYTGWVSVATVVGAASTGAALGANTSGTVATVLSVVALVATGVITLSVVRVAAAVAAYAVAVAWALGGIAVAQTPATVVAAATVTLAIIVLGGAWRIWRSAEPARVALG